MKFKFKFNRNMRNHDEVKRESQPLAEGDYKQHQASGAAAAGLSSNPAPAATAPHEPPADIYAKANNDNAEIGPTEAEENPKEGRNEDECVKVEVGREEEDEGQENLIPKDRWVDTEVEWVRIREVAPRRLFTPGGATEGPKEEHPGKLRTTRVTT